MSLFTIPLVYFFVFYVNNNIFLKSTIFGILAIIFFKFWLKINEKKYLIELFKNIVNLENKNIFLKYLLKIKIK
jgi:hypothetical protein